jgi:hypothetical protein
VDKGSETKNIRGFPESYSLKSSCEPFKLGDFLVTKMIGLTFSVAVLIGATLVRMVIGPALLRLTGDWNWWAGGRGS